MRFLIFTLILSCCIPAHALRPSNIVLLNAVSNALSKQSVVIDAQNIISGSIQASFTDNTASGTLTLECSNDNPSGLLVITTWNQ